VLERVDAEGERLNYYYDEAQRLIGHSDPGGTVVTFQRLDPETGERFQIDYEGRLASATLGANGLVESLESGDEGAFALEYDERFNLIRLTTPLGAGWTFARDRKGRLSAVISPAGRRVDVRHDGTTVAIEDGRGPRLRLTSDLFGRTVARTDGAGREQRFRYDPEGRLVGVEVDDGYRVTWTYDGAGRLLQTADSERREVRWSRDGAGRVLAIETGAERVRFTYDLAGRISAASGDAGEVRFGYDEQDRLQRVKGPRWMAFSYDEGQTTVRTAEQRRVFSALGEPIEAHEAEGDIRRFQYGPSGELVMAEREADGEATSMLFEYDPDGRLIRAERGAAAVDLGYDLDGLLATVEGEGHAFEIDYDDRLQPATLHCGDATYRFTFDEGGRLTAWDGDGLRRTFRYDALDRCTAVRADDGVERKTTAGAVERVPAGEGLIWVVAPRGVALVADGTALPVALWGREEMRVAPLRLDARIVRTLVLGADAALAAESDAVGPLVQRWHVLARSADMGAGIPKATPLGLPWPALDLFALARDCYDPHFARRLPGALPYHQPDRRRAPDEVLTGSHRAGVLQSRVWVERAHGPYLAPTAPLALPGGLTATLAHRLYRTLTRS
jgi:YD repeat-containing protein